tara:strand:+ start:12887 stop:13615 length:729 start_codon:yes stop_codon:yes gene_type:complete
MEKNTTGRYFKYATGEIILVVIGILIALNINNWNENQQVKQVEKASLNALLGEFKENNISIQKCLDNIKNRRLIGDTIRKMIGPKLTTVSVDKTNRIIGGISATDKCIVSKDALDDIKSSGKLNLLTNKNIRQNISKWTSLLDELRGEENDWAQEFANQFIPYANKWIMWDDVEVSFHQEDSRYFKSPFTEDPRRMLQQKEFSNIMAIQYWRIGRIERRTKQLLTQNNKLVAFIEEELKTNQ